MKIKDVIESMGIVLSNEERNFVTVHGEHVVLTGLDDHDIWLAQNLIRKGIYEISNNDNQINKAKNVFYLRPRTQ